MFRARYLDGLAWLLEQDQLDIPPQLAELAQPDGRRRWLRRLRKKPWVVYSQAPFAGPRKLLDYLGRYTHRVAISNHRLVACDDGMVHYRYRARRDGDRLKIDVLPAEEFLRRFLQHVLPDHFLRIRHYGLLANRAKQKHLGKIAASCSAPDRRLTSSPTRSPAGCMSWWGSTSHVVLVAVKNYAARCFPSHPPRQPPHRFHAPKVVRRLGKRPAWSLRNDGHSPANRTFLQRSDRPTETDRACLYR